MEITIDLSQENIEDLKRQIFNGVDTEWAKQIDTIAESLSTLANMAVEADSNRDTFVKIQKCLDSGFQALTDVKAALAKRQETEK